MTRHRHARSADIEPEQRSGSVRGGVPLPPGAAALLALQRQAGNMAVSRMIGNASYDPTETMPGAFPSVDDFPETEVSPAQVPRPRPPALDLSDLPPRPSAPTPRRARFQYAPELAPDTDSGSEPATPVRSSMDVLPGSPVERPESPDRRSLDVLPGSPVERPDTPPAPQPWHILPKTPGDYPKAAGAGIAVAFPGQSFGLVKAGSPPNLTSGATGMAAASATGDALSEVVKLLQGRGFNIGKFLGGVVTTGGLLTNAIAQSHGVAGDAARYGGLYLQTAGLVAKGVGEGIKLENGWHAVPDGDWSKAIGAFVAATAPALQAMAVRHQRDFEAMIRDGTRQGPVPTSNFAIAAAILSGASPAGDFASEVVKAVRDRKVNVPKMIGGLFGAAGAIALTVGVATGNDTAKYVGYGFQTAGLAAKGTGEGHTWEDIWPRLPRKERPEDLEMQAGAVRA